MSMTTLALTSPDFEDSGSIPVRYTCDGENINPELHIIGAPEEFQSFVLIMDDPDVPAEVGGGVFDHWVLFNIPSETRMIAAGSTVGTPGKNSSGSHAYTGPCPPKQYKPTEHRYFFKLYALDTILALPEGSSKKHVLDALERHVLSEAVLVGRYERE